MPGDSHAFYTFFLSDLMHQELVIEMIQQLYGSFSIILGLQVPGVILGLEKSMFTSV